MGTLILAVTTLFLYSLGTALQTLVFRGRIKQNHSLTSLIGILALVSHGTLIWTIIPEPSTLNFGFFPASLLISWFVVLFLVILNNFKPIQFLFLAIYPLAAITVVFVLAFHSPPHYVSQHNWGMLAHIALSITAYSLLRSPRCRHCWFTCRTDNSSETTTAWWCVTCRHCKQWNHCCLSYSGPASLS